MKKLITYLVFLLLFSNHSFAQTTDDLVREDIRIRQRVDQERQELERKRELDEAQRIKDKSFDLEESFKDKEFVDDGKCVLISKINISGNSKFHFRKLINENENKCLTKTDLKNLKSEIENSYFDAGYVLARVYFDVQKISDGKINIIIEEGKASEIEIMDNSKINEFAPFRRKLQKFFAFGPYEDKVVNLRDIEQGLDQINRLSSNNATMELSPGEKDGYSKIIVNNQIGNITKPSIGVNNAGNESTGRIRKSFNLDQDNLFGVNDNIYFSHSRSGNDGILKKYFKSNYINFSAPFAYYNFGVSYSGSDYLTTSSGGATNSTSSGRSSTYSYYVSRILKRSKSYKVSAKIALDDAINKNFVNGSFITTNSRELTVARLSLDNIFYTKFGTIFVQPKYNRGTKLLGALQDSKNANPDSARAQFDSYRLFASISNNFPLPKTNINLFHNLSFDGGISEDRLFSSEQISIGGRYTVRGFEESSISGDNGFYVKNDLGLNLFQVMPQIITSTSSGKFLQRINIGTFYDYGYVRNKIQNSEDDEGYMSGTGAKINYNGEYLKVDLTYSKGLHSPQFLRNVFGISKDDESIYLDVKLGLF